MLKIVIFTMVKNEEDIIKEWIEYHGNIFGFNNLCIIDNFSTDNTHEICKEYISKGILLRQETDYKKKGILTSEYSKSIKCDIFIPLNIDEFICYYDKKNNSVNKSDIITYLESIFDINYGLHKMKYLIPIKTNNSIGLNKFTHARIKDDKDNAKTFINCKKVEPNFLFDHGNNVPSTTYISSKLYLIHYHCRSHDQLVKKTTANVVGLENSDCNFEPKLEEEIKDDWTSIENILLV